MCGPDQPFPTYKNILVSGIITAGGSTIIARNLALPFAPRLMEITHFSYTGGVNVGEDSVITVTSSIIPDTLATFTLTNDAAAGINRDTVVLHEKFNLSPSAQVQGSHSFTFNGISGLGLPPSAAFKFAMNLRFVL